MKLRPDFIHEFVPGSSNRTLLLLHGTGGNERDLIALGRELDPNAALLSPRGKVLENGRMVHDLYLFEVKKPSESKARWDDYKLLATIPGNEAFQSLDASRCPLVKK